MTDRAKKIVIAVLILLTVIASVVYYYNYADDSQTAATIIRISDPAEETPPAIDETIDEPTAEPLPIKVHVAGAVNSPGLYEAAADSRVADLIELAGGPAENADLDRINLAGHVSDGQQIYVPKISDETGSGGAVDSGAADSGAADSGRSTSSLVNINTAGLDKLKTLPGIGDALGNAVISYRESHGNFRSVEDITNVPGIGEKRFEQIKDLITIK